MCLGVPGQIVAKHGKVATVDFWGLQRDVRLDVLEQAVAVGDYVVVHAGYAVRPIPPQEVADTLGLYEVVLCEAGEDPIARDVIEELQMTEDLELEPV